MAFNTKAQLQELKTLVEGVAGVQKVQIGVPESLPNRVCAFITMGPQPTTDKNAGLLQCLAQYQVTFAYKVAGAEDAAELALADILDGFKAAFFAARKTNGVLKGMQLDLTLANAPQYLAVAGQEFRQYPVAVTAKQEANS